MLDTKAPPPSKGIACRQIGRFIAKGSCFALRDHAGVDTWLEIDPIPLHLLGEEVEAKGRRYGADLMWVEGIGPTNLKQGDHLGAGK